MSWEDLCESDAVIRYLNLEPYCSDSSDGGVQAFAGPEQLPPMCPPPLMMSGAAGPGSLLPVRTSENNNNFIVAGGDSATAGKKKKTKARSPEDHEHHVMSERDRRMKMGCQFQGLQELLPRLTEKASKLEVLDEAISYIKTLESNLEELEKAKKMARIRAPAATLPARPAGRPPPSPLGVSSAADAANQARLSAAAAPSVAATAAASELFPAGFQTWTSPNVTVSLAGSYANISICTQPKRGLLDGISQSLFKHNLQVVSTIISSEGNKRFLTIHAHANGELAEQLLGAPNAIEEHFKRAAEEITALCISG